jgi:hypothetical protein
MAGEQRREEGRTARSLAEGSGARWQAGSAFGGAAAIPEIYRREVGSWIIGTLFQGTAGGEFVLQPAPIFEVQGLLQATAADSLILG